MGRYVFISVLGKGTFGVVYKCYDNVLHKDVAVKQIAKSSEYLTRETDMLYRIRNHEYCVQILDIFFSFTRQLCEFIVLEYIPHTLKDFIYRSRLNKLSKKYEETIPKILRCILQGLKHIHSLNIIHRDIKPENILIDDLADPNTIKICDFGSAKMIEDQSNPYVVSSFYRAPELVFGTVNYGCGIDMWSVGCILVELFNEAPLFDCRFESELFVKQVKVLGKPSKCTLKKFAQLAAVELDDLSKAVNKSVENSDKLNSFKNLPDSAVDLALKLLEWDTKKRYSAQQALSHPYLQKSV